MKYLIIIIFYIVTSCNVQKDLVKVKFSAFDLQSQTKQTYSFFIPKGYKEHKLKRSLESNERQFVYENGAIIYMTNETGTPIINYENIDNDSIAIQKSFWALMENDTLTVEGKDKQGRVWKNRKLKEISIGYLHVPESRREEFNKAMESLVPKEK